MPRDAFQNVRHWVFDLDNTLYPPQMRLFDQISEKMTLWIMRNLNLARDAADDLRKHYWADHGTTLAGLMADHSIAPWDFLTDVHDVDMSHLPNDPGLRTALLALPGRRIVFTNGDSPYARRVLAARGLSDCFDAIYGIEHTDWRPKPHRHAYDQIFAADALIPTQAAMFEDEGRNLQAPFEIGLRTVLVAPEAPDLPFIHHHTRDLTGFLSQITRPDLSADGRAP